MTYQAPVDDILQALKSAAGLDDLIGRGLLGSVDEDQGGVGGVAVCCSRMRRSN